jgi:hypothetical protein
MGKPNWKKNQQKKTGASDQESRGAAQETGMVKIKMITGYREFAKAGDIWETDVEKAAELVKLGRAKYLDGKKSK